MRQLHLTWTLALLLPLLGRSQGVIEIYNERGVVVLRYSGSEDSIISRVHSLPAARYVVSVSEIAHDDSTLWGMPITCMFADAFCQEDSPLQPDSVYDSGGFYDAYWISIDRRGNQPILLWEKRIRGGFFDGAMILYDDRSIPTYMANFKRGVLDGIKVEFDWESGLYSGKLYDYGRSVRMLSWANDESWFLDTQLKPSPR